MIKMTVDLATVLFNEGSVAAYTQVMTLAKTSPNCDTIHAFKFIDEQRQKVADERAKEEKKIRRAKLRHSKG